MNINLYLKYLNFNNYRANLSNSCLSIFFSSISLILPDSLIRISVVNESHIVEIRLYIIIVCNSHDDS